ncbi:MAG: S1C family serine protease [Candidatus Poribacteria bacterium]|nr:S1C family serine protease [Candidatus Poribacteria bacterium]
MIFLVKNRYSLHFIHAQLFGKETKFNIEGYTAIDEKRDLIILKVTAFGTQTISLGNSDYAQVGETVYAVGNPRGLEGTFSEGIISSIRPIGSDKLIQITAPLSPGSSGGPILNRSGEVIGVSVLTIRDGQNLNFAIPSNYIKKLFSNPPNLKPLYLTKFEGIIHIENSLLWEGKATYTFSLQNEHRFSVKDIHCLVTFYDEFSRQIGLDIVKVPGPIPAKGIKKVTRQSIFDVAYPKGLNLSTSKVDEQIAFCMSIILRDGKNPSDYNIVDPIAKRSEGTYRVRIIGHEKLPDFRTV